MLCLAPFFFFLDRVCPAPSCSLFIICLIITTTFLPLIYKHAERVCFVFWFYFIWSYLFVSLFGQPPTLLMDTKTIVRVLSIDEHKHRIQVRDKKQKRKKKKEKKTSHDQIDRERKERRKRKSQREKVRDSYPCKCIS